MGIKVIFVLVILNCTLCFKSYGDDNALNHRLRFDRKIKAIGYPYYAILMTIGKCKESLLFEEQKVWQGIKMNRILDIYYKSMNRYITVSQVEVVILMRGTDCIPYTDTGVGSDTFRGTIIFATNSSIALYRLRVYTCSWMGKDGGRHRPKLDDEGDMTL